MQVEHVEDGWWREQVDPARLRVDWENFPSLLVMLDDFVAAMRPGDELWLFDVADSVGLAVRRDGEAVKHDLYLVV